MSWWSVELRATGWERHELLPILPLHDGSGVCSWWTVCSCIPSSVNNILWNYQVRIDLYLSLCCLYKVRFKMFKYGWPENGISNFIHILLMADKVSTVKWWMAHYASGTAKRHYAYCSSTEIMVLDKGRLSGWKKVSSAKQTARKYKDRHGKDRYVGTRNLRNTETFNCILRMHHFCIYGSFNFGSSSMDWSIISIVRQLIWCHLQIVE